MEFKRYLGHIGQMRSIKCVDQHITNSLKIMSENNTEEK